MTVAKGFSVTREYSATIISVMRDRTENRILGWTWQRDGVMRFFFYFANVLRVIYPSVNGENSFWLILDDSVTHQ